MTLSKLDGSLSREGVEEALQVKGIKVLPEFIDTSRVQYTYDVSQFSKLEYLLEVPVTSVALAGLTVKQVDVIGPAGYTATVTTSQQNARCLGFSPRIQYDAAGLAADAGAILRWTLKDLLVTSSRELIGGQHTVNAVNINQYIEVLNHGFSWIIPWRYIGQFSIARDVGNFPANTLIVYSGLFEVRKRGLMI